MYISTAAAASSPFKICSARTTRSVFPITRNRNQLNLRVEHCRRCVFRSPSPPFKICSAGTTRAIFPVNRNQLNPWVFFSKESQTHHRCCVLRSHLTAPELSPPPFQECLVSIPPLVDHEAEKDANTEENLDKWMKGSVEEIVKNLKKAPLLVHVYDGDEIKAAEPAEEEEWDLMKKEWEKGKRISPKGLIFVKELIGEEANGVKKVEEEEDGETKVWGILVQGRGGGGGCGPACYLLKTTRVGAGIGLGLFCTQFCLIRVTSFWETALDQFNDSWLLN